MLLPHATRLRTTTPNFRMPEGRICCRLQHEIYFNTSQTKARMAAGWSFGLTRYYANCLSSFAHICSCPSYSRCENQEVIAHAALAQNFFWTVWE